MPIQFAEPCIVCGRLYLHGSVSTCESCLQTVNGGPTRQRKPCRVRCDCGKWASVIVIVRVGTPEDGYSEDRLPLCVHCLEVEKETQALLDRLGYS